MFEAPLIYYVMWIAGLYLMSIGMAMKTRNWQSYLLFRGFPFALGGWLMFIAFHFLGLM